MKRGRVPHGEITHIGVIQRRGWIETTDHADNATMSRAFTNREDVVAWVRHHVISAHGGEITMANVVDGVTTITSSDGPTWGCIIDVGIRS